jgi:hypothetical protein
VHSVDCLAGAAGPVTERLRRYEELRNRRVQQVQAGSRVNSEVFQLPDGEGQQRRDREMKAGYMANLEWLYGYDAEAATSGV